MSAVDALVEATEDGRVDDQDLLVEKVSDGYVFQTPERHESGLTEIALREIATGDPYVRDWHFWECIVEGQGTARRAFLKWLEDAPDRSPPERIDALESGITSEWGQLSIEVGLAGDGGERVYEIRHTEEKQRPLSELSVHDDPLSAREIVKRDDDGRYRPLKTAPTLPSGHAWVGLDEREIINAVEYIYPATIANWHREETGELDITHYRETAQRQTGIYALIEDLSPDRVADLAQACCVDSQCLKRREWDESADEDLDVPRGDGEFPCREPCSLVIAAARKFTILEGETPREYTFELTPSEKNQLEELIEAVSEDRLDDIREADLGDGANRYRVRYLRSKLMDDGDLCGVPTTGDHHD